MSPNTLFDIAGIQARIFTLPQRPPFMIAADLAEVYGSRVDAITQAVRRNPARFPEDFMFTFTEAEMDRLKTQNVLSMKANRAAQRGFTHAGAYALSAVLKTSVAAEVSVTVHRAFAAIEAKALADSRTMIAKLHVEAQRKKPIYGFIAMSMERGLTLEQMWRAANYPRWKLETAAREMLAMRMIDRLPVGMQADLFDGEAAHV